MTDEQVRAFNRTLSRIQREGGAGANDPGPRITEAEFTARRAVINRICDAACEDAQIARYESESPDRYDIETAAKEAAYAARRAAMEALEAEYDDPTDAADIFFEEAGLIEKTP